jgi:hypothetical protein
MKKAIVSLVLAVLIVTALSACGGGGSGGQCPTTEPTNCIAGLSGEWTVTDTTHTSSDYCSGADGFTNTYTVGVTQVGCAITVDTPVGTFHGFVDGNTLCWSGSYAFEGGTTTITGMTIQSNDPPTTFDGSSSWTWTDGVGNCEGSTTTTGTKS